MSKGTITLDREFLERIESGMWYKDDRKILAKELQEILDKTICKACRGSGHIDNLRPVGEPAITCPYCIGTPEPVGEVRDMKYNVVRFYRATGDASKPYLFPGTKLYVEQPLASVALPERKTYVFSSCDETSEEGTIQYNKALDDVMKLNGINHEY